VLDRDNITSVLQGYNKTGTVSTYNVTWRRVRVTIAAVEKQ